MSKFFYPARIVFIILSVAIMIIIFMFSRENSNESSQTSGHFTQFVLENVVSGYDEMPLVKKEKTHDIVDHIIRKSAHFTVYAALGVCVSSAVGKRRYFSLGSLLTVGICFIYACSDELHQYFVPGRAGMFSDVMLDTSGGITGMTLILLVMACIFSKAEKNT